MPIHLFDSATATSLYARQEKLWGQEGDLGQLDGAFDLHIKDPRIPLLMRDIQLLRSSIDAPSSQELAGRITPQFKVHTLALIDSIRRQIKEQRKNDKRNFSRYHGYDAAIDRLKRIRVILHRCPCIEPQYNLSFPPSFRNRKYHVLGSPRFSIH